jgi:hypothetical protein
MDTEQTLNGLIELHKNYSTVHRRTIALDKYGSNKLEVEPTNEVVRESLLEHIGSLPVVATYLYPLLEQKNKVDLGKVLTMLAVHDIGETVVGDSHPHQKTESSIETERLEALKLLSKEYHSVFEESENGETLEAKFAKSVDVFATFLVDLMLPPEYVAKRLAAYNFSSELFVEKRYEVFAWDNSLKVLFAEVIKRYQKMGL